MSRKPIPLSPNQIYHHPRKDYMAQLQFHIAAGRFLQRKGWTMDEVKTVFDLLSVREVSRMIDKMKHGYRSKYEPH